MVNSKKFKILISTIALVSTMNLVACSSLDLEKLTDKAYSTVQQPNADDYFLKGYKYYAGKGVKKNYKKAFPYFYKCSQLGSKICQTTVGDMYHKGKGIAKDQVKAVYWYKKAANQGDAYAATKIGYIYLYGIGTVKKNALKAMYWSKKAEGKKGGETAQFNIGLMYQSGFGVKQSNRIAKNWYRKACNNGKQCGCDAYRNLR